MREIAAVTGSQLHAVRLKCQRPSDPPEKPRAGTEVRLPLEHCSFRKVFAIKARHLSHSGALEAAGVVLASRRLSRQRRLHNQRGVFLVYTQAVQAALQQGRSSAPTLRRPVAPASAIAFACGWRLRCAYISSGSNRAEEPVRGKGLSSRVRNSQCVLTKYRPICIAVPPGPGSMPTSSTVCSHPPLHRLPVLILFWQLHEVEVPASF